MAKHLGHHTGGLLDITYDIHSKRYIDPSDQILIHHIKAIHHLIQAWPPDQLPALEQAWQTTYQQLQTTQYPWYSVRGPLAATIVYLQEWGWKPTELMRWMRPESKLLLANELRIQHPWWQLERALTQEAQWQRISRLASKPHYQGLITGIDWRTYRQVRKQLKAQQKHHLDTWVQAALQFRGQKLPPLPCSGYSEAHTVPMPPEWMNRLTCQDEEPLWAHGWIPLEPQEARAQPHPYQGHGCWAGLQILSLQQHSGWAFTLDATPSSYEPRSQLWIFGLCARTMTLGQLCRLGTITGVTPGAQTKVEWTCGPGQTYRRSG